MKKKLFYTVLTSVTILLILAGCQTKKTNTLTEPPSDANNAEKTLVENDKTTELEFWSFWGGGARKDVIEDIIDDFNQSQDRIVVKPKYQPWGDIWTKSLAAISAGNPPDVIVQDINSVAQRAEAKQNTNIQTYLNKDIKKRFYPQLWETALHQEDAYGLPFNTDTRVIFYNKKLFKKNGLTEKDIPKTWKELQDIAYQLDEKKDDVYQTIGFYPLWNIEADTWALNADKGTSWFDHNEQIKINTPAKVDTMKWLKSFKKHYGEEVINNYEAEFGSGVADPFLSGLVAMRADNINYFTNIKENAPDDFEFGVFQLPEYKEGTGHYTWGGGFVLEIPYGAKHPKESYQFMKYLTDKKVQEKFGQASFDIMANKAANRSLIKGNQLNTEGKMIYQLADEVFPYTILTPVPLKSPGFQPILKGKIDDILIKGEDPEKALQEAEEKIEKLKK